MRAAVKQAKPDAVFSTTLIAGEKDDYLKLLHDWPTWLEQGLVDEFYIWFRTKLRPRRAQAAVVLRRRSRRREHTRHCRALLLPSRQLPTARPDAARRRAGAGLRRRRRRIYRSHAVEQLDFWPVLEKMGKL